VKLKTPLARARGLGSAKQGTGHWWYQRLTAILLVPLTLWIMISLVMLTSLEHKDVLVWMSSSFNTILLLILVVTLFYHAQLGIQVVIEDYIHSEWQKIACLVLVRFIVMLAGLASVLAILKIFLGS